MKKFFITLLMLVGFLPVFGATLSGGISANNVNNGFFGNWIVHGEIIGEPPKGFKFSTNQIWNLRKENTVIILENKISGAKGQININKAYNTSNGAFLKFSNRDEKRLDNGVKIILIETPELTLKNEEFTGIDTFQIKKYKNGTLYKQEVVKYEITGKKIK